MKKLSLIFAVLLAGCGGGSSSTFIPPSPGPTPTPMGDAFFAQVQAVAAQPDDAEAASIDALAAATAPEDSEPVSL